MLCACYVGVMWDVSGAVWAVASFMWIVAACMHASHAICGLLHPLCGLLQPPCGLSLAKTGKEYRERRHGTKTKNVEQRIREDKDGEKKEKRVPCPPLLKNIVYLLKKEKTGYPVSETKAVFEHV